MADDALDDFLAELESNPATPLHSSSFPSNNSQIASSFVLDDELADIFGVEASPSVTVKSSLNISSSHEVSSLVNDLSTDGGTVPVAPKDDGDILSWLGDTPTKTLDSYPIKAPKDSLSAAATMDNFFDEVFGDTLSAPSSVVKARATDIHDEIVDAVQSSFPDVSQIRNLIHRAGYIPAEVRGLVWCLLLTGSTTEDHEADYYHPSGAELPDASRLNADVDALMTYIASCDGASSIDIVQCRQDVHDILVLYCVRRQAVYQPVYCSLLAPMIAVSQGAMSRSLASSCFYSLATEFVPIINLKVYTCIYIVDIDIASYVYIVM